MTPWLAGHCERARSPWASVAFVTPLLIVYEIGLYFISATPDEIRTGADSGLRWFVAHLGVTAPMFAPILLLAGLFAWASFVTEPPWRDPVGTWIGMAVESTLLAGLFFGLVQLAYPLLAFLGDRMQEMMPRLLDMSPGRTPEMTWEMILRFIGAGIYEETLFRLVGLTLLRHLFLAGEMSERVANLLAGVVSAIVFAAAHHWGTSDTVHATVFLYRLMAGLYFAAVFQVRGFGIAVGAHLGYDVLVGLILR